jgi:hypothetical protein
MTSIVDEYIDHFTVQGKVWRYSGPSGWFFVNVGEKESNFIRSVGDISKVGWGYVSVLAKIGNTAWKTKLFPDKNKCYLIAIKADVRKKEHINEGDEVCIEVSLI